MVAVGSAEPAPSGHAPGRLLTWAASIGGTLPQQPLLLLLLLSLLLLMADEAEMERRTDKDPRSLFTCSCVLGWDGLPFWASSGKERAEDGTGRTDASTSPLTFDSLHLPSLHLYSRAEGRAEVSVARREVPGQE